MRRRFVALAVPPLLLLFFWLWPEAAPEVISRFSFRH